MLLLSSLFGRRLRNPYAPGTSGSSTEGTGRQCTEPSGSGPGLSTTCPDIYGCRFSGHYDPARSSLRPPVVPCLPSETGGRLGPCMIHPLVSSQCNRLVVCHGSPGGPRPWSRRTDVRRFIVSTRTRLDPSVFPVFYVPGPGRRLKRAPEGRS